MKYEPINKTAVKSLSINSFDGGINLDNAPNNIEDNQLSEAINMWYREGKLEKRPGICGDLRNLLWTDEMYYQDNITYKLYDNTICIASREYKVLTICLWDNSESYYNYQIRFIGKDGTILNAGELSFRRTASDIFYVPQNLQFISGKSEYGGGVFAFATLVNIYNPTERINNVFEINLEYRNWQRITGYYVPTVYVNGRGNHFEQANAEGYAYKGTPMKVESLNMISGGFKAYFTSDGYSTSFSLPYVNLDYNREVVCRVYVDTSLYIEWVIRPDVIIDTKTFYGKNISVYVDREKGILTFKEASNEFPVPKISQYNQNNICIMAYKALDANQENVISSAIVEKSGNKVLLTGGLDGNIVYCSSSDNPLYFPQASTVRVGDDGIRITALKVYNGTVYAFKRNGIYRVDITHGKMIDKNLILSDNDKFFYSVDTLSVKNVCEDIGIEYASTLKQCGKNLVWLSSDNEVCSMSPSGEITNISYNIAKNLMKVSKEFRSDTMKPHAVIVDGNYLLIFENKIFVMNFSVKGIRYPSSAWKTRDNNCSWYYWEHNKSFCIIDAVIIENKLKLICGRKSNGACYFAELKGEKDVLVSYYNKDEIYLDEEKVNAIVRTKFFDMGNIFTKKFIDKINILAKGDIKIRYLSPICIGEHRLLTDDSEAIYLSESDFSKIVFGKGVRMIGFEFSSDKNISLEAIEIKYHPSAF